MSSALPIGVFDSGVGGLTVLRVIQRLLPHESTIYVGDSAYFPYGPKPAEAVIARATSITAYLMSNNVKAVVVACNTASAMALPLLSAWCRVPTIGVVQPGAGAALARTLSGRIGVLATEGTVRSGAYERALVSRRPDVVVHQRAAGSLVEAIESGSMLAGRTEQLVRPLLEELIRLGCDTVILGCTHFPLVQGVFERVAGSDITIVDSAAATVEALRTVLAATGTGAPDHATAHHRTMVTSAPESFTRQARLLFGDTITARLLPAEMIPSQPVAAVGRNPA